MATSEFVALLHSDLSHSLPFLLPMSSLLSSYAPTGVHVELTGLSTFLFLMILGFHLAYINLFYLDLGAISVLQASVMTSHL